jgi:putative serine protease PepD
VGDPVVAIGSPFSLPETTTTGIVSQVGRGITAPNGYTIPNAIQTDAAINPGNSGGPLLDANGHVLGLNDQIETNNQTAGGEGSSSGVGFAVPSNTVKQVANTIIAGKQVQHAYIGVCLNGDNLSAATIATTPTQSCPNPVSPGSPAARSGIQPGDTVTAINGTPIATTEQFIATIDNYKPGQTVTMAVKHSGQIKQVKVTLAQRPAKTPAGG